MRGCSAFWLTFILAMFTSNSHASWCDKILLQGVHRELKADEEVRLELLQRALQRSIDTLSGLSGSINHLSDPQQVHAHVAAGAELSENYLFYFSELPILGAIDGGVQQVVAQIRQLRAPLRRGSVPDMRRDMKELIRAQSLLKVGVEDVLGPTAMFGTLDQVAGEQLAAWQRVASFFLHAVHPDQNSMVPAAYYFCLGNLTLQLAEQMPRLRRAVIKSARPASDRSALLTDLDLVIFRPRLGLMALMKQVLHRAQEHFNSVMTQGQGLEKLPAEEVYKFRNFVLLMETLIAHYVATPESPFDLAKFPPEVRRMYRGLYSMQEQEWLEVARLAAHNDYFYLGHRDVSNEKAYVH